MAEFRVSTPEEFEAETVRRALAGDAAAGREALRLCCTGLLSGSISGLLADYLAQRLMMVDDALTQAEALRDVKKSSGSARSTRDAAIAEALCIARRPGRPRDPLPDWQQPYAALGFLLMQAGVTRADAKRAMIAARLSLEKRSLDASDAGKILSAYAPLKDFDREDLLHLLGEKLRKELPTFSPQKVKR